MTVAVSPLPSKRYLAVMKPRTAELVLVTPDGVPIGSLPPVPVATPWWQDVEPVVSAARDHHGINVVILRLLNAELPQPHCGCVTYLAEVAEPVCAAPWTGVLEEHPRRHSFARAGGPTADLGWARAQLAKRGLRPTAPATQVRTWNLSSLWRVPVEGQTTWLKVVPHFFSHEGRLLATMDGRGVPTVLGHEGGRMLLAEVTGRDLYVADLPQRNEMVNVIVGLQRQWTDRVEELLALGLPDWRAAALSAAIVEVVDRTSDEVSADERMTLAEFLRDLPSRFEDIAACGLRDSLVHGDFHSGNFRGDGQSLTLLDWGDSCVGHPLLDQAAFLDATPYATAVAVRAHWAQEWRDVVPGSDPVRAAALLAPIAAARQAVIYRRFLDNIEPSEHPYHKADPAMWLKRTAALAEDHER
jgi:hypothetical protein